MALVETPAAGAIAGQPLVGHLIAFRRDRLRLLDACVRARDDVVELRIRTPAYLLKRPEDVGHVFLDRVGAYAKDQRNVDPRATRIFGDGLMTSTGARHRDMRRGVQPVFRRGFLEPLGELAVRGADAMVDRWEESQEIDLADEMERLALDTLVASIFGVDSKAGLAVLADGVTARRHSMTRGLNAAVRLPGFLPMAVHPRRRRAIRSLDEAIERLIRARSKERAGGGDLLSMLISAHQGSAPAANGSPIVPDPRSVRDQVLTFALAAYENVARALTWSLHALTRNREIDGTLRTEVRGALGRRRPESADCTRLPYTQMVLAESLRLWPPNALLSRVARRDDLLPTGTRVRAGSKVLLSPYVVHRDPAYYPDPERFDPERFSVDGSRGRPRYAYFPFGGGPRVCIGRALATQQCTLVLARLAQRIRLELAGQPAHYVCGCLPAGFGPRMVVVGR